MAKKDPKTERGRVRKLWTGDGRRRTPMENLSKDMDGMVKDMNKSLDMSLGGGSKKRKGKKEIKWW